ncbi:MAG: hypothetical protein Q9186_005974 [Xanthomendoza sp. 1 TL-2023]
MAPFSSLAIDEQYTNQLPPPLRFLQHPIATTLPLETRDVGFQGRGVQLVLVAIIFTSIALATVIARFVCRHHNAKQYGMDDWIIAISMNSYALLSFQSSPAPSETSKGVNHGIGKHIQTLSRSDRQQALLSFYLSQTLYKSTINLTKLSILSLYLRLFPNIPWFRRATLITITYIALYALASIIAGIFQCVPVSRAWDHSQVGRCIDITVFWYCNAIQNVVGDIVVLGLPVKVVWGLRMKRAEKGGVLAVFGLGVL